MRRSGRVDVDVDVVVHLGGDEDRGERGVTAVAGIERGLANEAVHSGLGAEPPVGVVARDADGDALHPRHLARRLLEQLRVEAAVLGPAKVHPQQHGRPVLRLRSPRAGSHLEECVAAVHGPGEHPPKLDPADLGVQALHVLLDRPGGILVPVRRRKLEQLGRVREPRVGPIDRVDDTFETDALATERLRPLRVSPDRGILQLAPDPGQPLALRGDVKDTP